MKAISPAEEARIAETNGAPYGRKTQREPADKEVHILWTPDGLSCGGKDSRDAHFITSRIRGICGDNHATCAVYAQNMAFGIRTPDMGEWITNLGEAAEYMFDHNIFQENLVGVDFCEPMVKETNPKVWDSALRTPARGVPDEVVLRTLVSTHSILGVRGGEFVSLLEPPDDCRAAAAACQNRGTWPVLVGDHHDRDTMLSSPIIRYDYPCVAPESPGDFFDAAEIDEMLTLRILTLTDEEKRAMAGVDARAAALPARTEATTREQLGRLHGTLRDLRPVE